jgi:biopolymer transport protein TolQ
LVFLIFRKFEVLKTKENQLISNSLKSVPNILEKIFLKRFIRILHALKEERRLKKRFEKKYLIENLIFCAMKHSKVCFKIVKGRKMETETLSDIATSTAAQVSLWDMVWSSDTITKVVMIGLIAASIWSWAIIFEKFATLRQVKKTSKKFEEAFWSGGSLDRLYDAIGNHPRDPMSAMFIAAMKEWRRTNIMKSKTDRGLRGVSLQQRIEKAMSVSMDKELDDLDNRLGFLASTGSVAPLIGLFGTVWGIISSFNAIAATQNNSLAAIAPGIAEALFTTAFGLIAAIPAVVAYNMITSDIDRYTKRLENFIDEFSTILSREIDDSTIKADLAGE